MSDDSKTVRFTPWASRACLLVGLLAFFLPFLAVSCDAPGGFGRSSPGGTTSYTGFDLAVGGSPSLDAERLRAVSDQQPDDLGVQVLVAAGAVVLVFAFGLSFAGEPRRFVVPLAVAAAAATTLGILLARSNLVDLVATQATQPFPDGKSAGNYVKIGIGAWLAVVLTIFGAGLRWMADRNG